LQHFGTEQHRKRHDAGRTDGDQFDRVRAADGRKHELGRDDADGPDQLRGWKLTRRGDRGSGRWVGRRQFCDRFERRQLDEGDSRIPHRREHADRDLVPGRRVGIDLGQGRGFRGRCCEHGHFGMEGCCDGQSARRSSRGRKRLVNDRLDPPDHDDVGERSRPGSHQLSRLGIRISVDFRFHFTRQLRRLRDEGTSGISGWLSSRLPPGHLEPLGRDAERRAEEPLGDAFYKITDDFDYASNSFDRFIDVEGEANHIRSVFYVRGKFWVVVDKVLTDKPRKIDALWHWHPECIVEQDGLIVKTNHERGNLAVIPLSGQKFEIAFVKGQETPDIQGWYSPEYNVFEPNIASIYSTEIKENTTLVWLPLPSDAQMSPVSAEILSENVKEVQIDVKSDKEGWRIHIPFMNSKDAKLTRH
jgi:hypothetical protein